MNRTLFPVLICVCMLLGCGGYDEISPQAYEYSKALYSICNRSDQARLEQFAAQLASAEEKQELTSTEAAWLNNIVATAQSGDWPSATKEARQLMEDQIHHP